MTIGGSGSGDGDIISSTQSSSRIVDDVYTLPGQASGERIGGGKIRYYTWMGLTAFFIKLFETS